MNQVEQLIQVSNDLEMNDAFAAAGPGQVIVFKPGVYRRPLKIKRGGEVGSPLRIEAEEAGTVVFSGADRVTGCGWESNGSDCWWVDYTPDKLEAEERLREHFGFITTPCQVWVGEHRLECCEDLDDLNENGFAVTEDRLWLKLPAGEDPNQLQVEVARRGCMLDVDASHVELVGLKVTRCASSVQLAGAWFRGSDLRIENCEFSEAAGGIGAHFDADDSVETGNTSDYNFFWNRHNLHPLDGGHQLSDWTAMTGLDEHSYYDKMAHFGPLLQDETMDGVAYDPAGPIPGFKVPQIDEVPEDARGVRRSTETSVGPFEL